VLKPYFYASGESSTNMAQHFAEFYCGQLAKTKWPTQVTRTSSKTSRPRPGARGLAQHPSWPGRWVSMARCRRNLLRTVFGSFE